jgi:hypothetical protein
LVVLGLATHAALTHYPHANSDLGSNNLMEVSVELFQGLTSLRQL